MMKANMRKGWMVANLIVIGLAISTYFSLYTIQPMYPYNNMVTDERSPRFEWSGYCDSCIILLDDDQGFRTPMEFRASGDHLQLGEELDFGTYWWKISGHGVVSQPRRFTVVSTVALSRPVSSIVRNAGNTPLLVQRSGLAGAVTLAVNQSLEITEDEHVRAEQK